MHAFGNPQSIHQHNKLRPLLSHIRCERTAYPNHRGQTSFAETLPSVCGSRNTQPFGVRFLTAAPWRAFHAKRNPRLFLPKGGDARFREAYRRVMPRKTAACSRVRVRAIPWRERPVLRAQRDYIRPGRVEAARDVPPETTFSLEGDAMANGRMGRRAAPRTRAVGLHGARLTSALYRVGCATAPELAALVGIPRRAANEQLLALLRSGYAARVRSWPSWHPDPVGRAPDVYHLERRGVELGAAECGVEDEDLARRRYKRCRVPASLSHVELRTAYYDELAAACGASRGAWLLEAWAEHAPVYPLREAAAAPGISALAGSRRGEVQPDGMVVLAVEAPGASREALGLRMHLEAETGSRKTSDAAVKAAAYALRDAARCRAREPAGRPPRGAYLSAPEGGWEPVIFLAPTARAAGRMRERAARDLPSHPWASPFLRAMAGQHGVHPGWFVLFVGLDEARGSGALSAVYRPLTPHPPYEGDSNSMERVNLADVADLASWVGEPM